MKGTRSHLADSAWIAGHFTGFLAKICP